MIILSCIFNRSTIWISYIFYIISLHGNKNSTNWPSSQSVASQLSWLSIALVSRRSRVRIPLKPWYFSGSFLPIVKMENLLRWFFTFIYNRSTTWISNIFREIQILSNFKYFSWKEFIWKNDCLSKNTETTKEKKEIWVTGKASWCVVFRNLNTHMRLRKFGDNFLARVPMPHPVQPIKIG